MSHVRPVEPNRAPSGERVGTWVYGSWVSLQGSDGLRDWCVAAQQVERLADGVVGLD